MSPRACARMCAAASGLVLLLVAGCSFDGAHPAAGSSSSSAEPATYTNPVFSSDFPDPGLVRAGPTWFAYGTQGNEKNVRTLTSTDLVHWQPGPDALPEVGRWASAGNTWAPEVIALGHGFGLYYVAHDNRSGKQCIGLAFASKAGGPYVDRSAAPLVCQSRIGGSIDPNPVQDPDGQLYLYWKNDGNCCGAAVHLWGQRLSTDGRRLVGRARALLSNTKAWQGALVEAPEMVSHDGTHTLLYSANDYASGRYGIGYAECQGPLGPCIDRSEAPAVASNDVAVGPGHCYVIKDADGGWWMLLHSWLPDAVGTQSPGRVLWLEPLTWKGATPLVHPPSTRPQASPPAA